MPNTMTLTPALISRQSRIITHPVVRCKVCADFLNTFSLTVSKACFKF